ncbi:hypothetical protein C0Q70_02416 [Pomacea canaliculata]|uniref:Sialin n=1 Tax=Pomacea canaliculata TaxID=400727 RepID=A0A2T7PPU7_POMCA|nr:sialin-like [Pomacea canaliculata]XP_025084446.1 sialin-like [Pomacea canaliculata]PVD35454.1 hypothetical protein C0Q70_02416 [Pomacea canaliculata]
MKRTEREEGTDGETVPCFFSQRTLMAVMGFFGFIFVYGLRVNLSVAIVCMVKKDNTTGNTSTNVSSCGADDSNTSYSKNVGEFDWDKSTQSSIMASFFYGYIVTQLPGGWMAGRFGGQRVLLVGMSIVTLTTLLFPVLARTDYRLVYVLRVINGLASGVSFSSMHTLLGRWAPPRERSRLASFVYSGHMVGNILIYIGAGQLCAYGFDNGWGSVFYLSGSICVVWLVLWGLLVSESPEKCKRISEAERNYIMKSIGSQLGQKFKVPWKAVFTSKAMWVCLIANTCNNFMHFTLQTSLPIFMDEVLHFNIQQNGLLSAVPYMAMAVSSVAGSHVADYCIRRCLSTKVTRRLFQVVAFVGSGSCLVATGFIPCENRHLGPVLLALAVGFEGLCFSGYMVNQIDFAPRYAGFLMGVSSFFSTIPGLIAPLIVGALTPNKTQEEWRLVFYICAGIALLGAIVFGLFAQTDEEPWAKETTKDISLPSKETSKEAHTYDNKAWNPDDEPEKTVYNIEL